MLSINFTGSGCSVSSAHSISSNLFEQVDNIVVEVVCTPPSKQTISVIANEVCEFMTGFMPSGIEVKNSLVIYDQKEYSDSSGTYINSFKIQVYI